MLQICTFIIQMSESRSMSPWVSFTYFSLIFHNLCYTSDMLSLCQQLEIQFYNMYLIYRHVDGMSKINWIWKALQIKSYIHIFIRRVIHEEDNR